MQNKSNPNSKSNSKKQITKVNQQVSAPSFQQQGAPSIQQQMNINNFSNNYAAPPMFQQQQLQMNNFSNMQAGPLPQQANFSNMNNFNNMNSLNMNYIPNNFSVQATQNSPLNIPVDNEPLPTPTTQTTTTTGKTDNKLTIEQIKEKIQLSMSLKHAQIVPNKAPVKMPMLVTITADDFENGNTPIDLVCVLDISGSMQGEKIQLLKSTFPILMELLSDKDRVSIVTFNSNAQKVSPLLCMTEKNKDLTLKAVNYITAGGGTNISSGMTLALEILKTRKECNAVTGVFLLTDGQDQLGTQGCITSISNLMTTYSTFENSRDYSLNTFGFGRDHDAKILGDVAVKKEGNFYFIEKIDQVDEAFGDCLVGLQSILASDIEFEIQPVDSEVFKGVKIVEGHGPDGFWKTFGGKYYAQLKNIVSGKSRNLVLEIEIPPVSSSSVIDCPIRIATANANMMALTDKGKEKYGLSSDLNIIVSDKGQSEEDIEVVFNYFRIKFANVMSLCKTYSDTGNYSKSQELLKELKGRLTGYTDERFIGLVKDIDSAIDNNKEKTYSVKGNQFMVQNMNNFYNESSNVNNCIQFQSKKQSVMQQQIQFTKSKK